MSLYTSFVRDFAARTLENLDAIEMQQLKFHEVTQLINSLLGMVVFIQAKEKVAATPLSEIKGFPQVCYVLGEGETSTLCRFVKYLRHAIAHGNVEAKGLDSSITHLEFWNVPLGTNTENWRIRWHVDDVRWIAIYLTKIVTD